MSNNNSNSNSNSKKTIIASSLFVGSVAKAFLILDAFSNTRDDLSLSEISQVTGFDKSTTQRFTNTLKELGYLEKDKNNARYRLGKAVLDLSYNYLRSNSLVERSTPALIALRNACGERAHLSLFDDTTLIFVIRQNTKREYFDGSLIGRRTPLFMSSGGRTILAKLSDAHVKNIISRSTLQPSTRYTIIDPDKIFEKVIEARQLGYSIAEQETVLGEITVSAAVTDANGYPLGAVHIAASFGEWNREEFERKCAHMVVETAQSLSHSL